MKTYTHNGKVIGELSGSVFRKKVNLKKHLHRNTDSIGIQQEVLDELPPETEIRILDTDTDNVYYTHVGTYQEKGFSMDWGYGMQRFLKRGEFTVKKLERIVDKQ